jgi:hypothetical protein
MWKCYALTLGEPALMKDLVRTFDPVDEVETVGTVKEQDAFQQRHWTEFSRRLSSWRRERLQERASLY